MEKLNYKFIWLLFLIIKNYQNENKKRLFNNIGSIQKRGN